MARKARRPARRAASSRLPAPVAAALRDLEGKNGDPRLALLRALTATEELAKMWREMAHRQLVVARLRRRGRPRAIAIDPDILNAAIRRSRAKSAEGIRRRMDRGESIECPPPRDAYRGTGRDGAHGNGWVYEFLNVLLDSGALSIRAPAPYVLLRPTDAKKKAARIRQKYREIVGIYRVLGMDYPVARSGATPQHSISDRTPDHGLKISDVLEHHAAVAEKMLLNNRLASRRQSTVRGRRVADQRQLYLLRRVAAYVGIAFGHGLVDAITADTARALFDLDYSRRDMHKLLTRRSAK